MLVKKADGRLEEFSEQKIINTCLRSGLSESQAGTVLKSVTKDIYEKMPTRELLRIVLKEIHKNDPVSSMKYNLRAALSALKPEGMFFEKYVKKLLEEYGYSVEWSIIVKGKCTSHEVDLIAKKDNLKIMIECKHHTNYHTFVGLGDALESWASWEDIGNQFDEAWLVCNTKISEHASKYSSCKGLKVMCWNYSQGLPELNKMIEEKKLYPITVLEGVLSNHMKRAYENDIITIKDVIRAEQQVLKNVFGPVARKILPVAAGMLRS